VVSGIRKYICFVIGPLPERIADVLGVEPFFL